MCGVQFQVEGKVLPVMQSVHRIVAQHIRVEQSAMAEADPSFVPIVSVSHGNPAKGLFPAPFRRYP